MLRDLLQAQQRGLGDGRHGGTDPPLLGVLLVTGDLDGDPPVAQTGTDFDHERSRTPNSASFFFSSSRGTSA